MSGESNDDGRYFHVFHASSPKAELGELRDLLHRAIVPAELRPVSVEELESLLHNQESSPFSDDEARRILKQAKALRLAEEASRAGRSTDSLWSVETLDANRKVAVRCPDCGKPYAIAIQHLGKRFRCNECNRHFVPEAADVSRWSAASRLPSAIEGPSPAPGSGDSPPPADAEPLAASPGPAGDETGDSVPSQIGRFVILRWLGSGTFGDVYRAHDPVLEREVAVKVSRASVMEHKRAKALFLQEPKAAGQLRHPNIVPIFDAGTHGEHYYIASAFIEGETLQCEIEKDRPDHRRAATMIRRLAQALHYAHNEGIIHRDIKPSNVMVDRQGQALLLDFGLARIEHSQAARDEKSKVMGTVPYMAPEQAHDEFGEVGRASDQYSLGVVLYEMLCGQRPFNGPPAVVMFNLAHNDPPRPRTIDASIPRDLEAICLKAMAKRPEDRYANCGDFASDLRRWLEGDLTEARPVGNVERFARWCRRNPLVAGLGTTAALLILAVAGIAIASYFSEVEHGRAIAQQHEDLERSYEVSSEAFKFGFSAVDELFDNFSDDEQLKAHPELRASLLTTAQHFYDEFRKLMEKHKNSRDKQSLLTELDEEYGQVHIKLAIINDQFGNKSQAISFYKRAIDILTPIASEIEDPEHKYKAQCQIAECHAKLGIVYGSMGEVAAAQRSCDDSLKLWLELKDRNGLAGAYNSLGIIHWVKDDLVTAKRYFDAAANIYDDPGQNAVDTPSSQAGLDSQFRHAAMANNWTVFYLITGDYKAAKEKADRALKLWQTLEEENHQEPEYRHGLARAHANLGVLSLYDEQLDAQIAEESFNHAVSILTELSQENPAFPQYQSDLAEVRVYQGSMREQLREENLADERYQMALEIYDRLGDSFDENPEIHFGHATALTHAGRFHAAADDLPLALEQLGQAVEILEGLAVEKPDVAKYASALAPVYHELGNVARDLGSLNGALFWYDLAITRAELDLTRPPRQIVPEALRLTFETPSTPLKMDVALTAFVAPPLREGDLIPFTDAFAAVLERQSRSAADPDQTPARTAAGRTLRSAYRDRANVKQQLSGRIPAVEADRRLAEPSGHRPPGKRYFDAFRDAASAERRLKIALAAKSLTEESDAYNAYKVTLLEELIRLHPRTPQEEKARAELESYWTRTAPAAREKLNRLSARSALEQAGELRRLIWELPAEPPAGLPDLADKPVRVEAGERLKQLQERRDRAAEPQLARCRGILDSTEPDQARGALRELLDDYPDTVIALARP